MGFFNNMADKIIEAGHKERERRQAEKEKGGESSGLPSDFARNEQVSLRDNLDTGNPQSYEPHKKMDYPKVGGGQSLLIASLALGALALYVFSQPDTSKTKAWVEAAPAPVAAPAQETIPLTDDVGGDWYVISNYTGECKPDEGPADMIKNLKTLGQPYQIKEDVVEGNRPMQVRLLLNDGFESGQIIYYRGEARCKAAASAKQQAVDAELNRYK
jgi:hypothetical protein